MSRRTCVLLRYFILMNSSILTRWIRKIPIVLKGLPCYRAPLFAVHRNQNVRNRYFFQMSCCAVSLPYLCHKSPSSRDLISTCTIAFKRISSWMFVQCFGYLTATSLQQFMLYYYIIKISNDIGDGQCEFTT